MSKSKGKNAAPLAQRRGCEWDDYNNGFQILLVRAPAVDVAKAMAGRDKVEPIDPHHTKETYPNLDGTVFRHAGHEWSITLNGGWDDKLPVRLSKALKTRVLMLAHEDTGGWTQFCVFDKGVNVETYTFGPDYDELAELAEELGKAKPAIMPSDGGKPWDHEVKRKGYDYRFRSTLRKVDPKGLAKDDKVLDEALKAADAWLRGWAHLPWAGAGLQPKPKGAKAEFAEAFAVRRK